MPLEELRQNGMMAHLLDALDKGESIGQYGPLVFVMVARHFIDENDVITYLQKDPECDEDKARSLLNQVQGRDYNAPRKDRILE